MVREKKASDARDRILDFRMVSCSNLRNLINVRFSMVEKFSSINFKERRLIKLNWIAAGIRWIELGSNSIINSSR